MNARLEALKTRHAPPAVRTLALAAGLFALLGVFASKEASASLSTELVFTNNTAVTLDSPVVAFGGQEYWTACVDGSAANGPPAQIAPGASVCLGTANDGNPFAGTGGSITYTMDNGPCYNSQNQQVACPVDTVVLSWNSPYESEPPLGLNDYTCAAQASTCDSFSPCAIGSSEDNFYVGFESNGSTIPCSNPNGYIVEWQLNEAAPTKKGTSSMSGYKGNQIGIYGTNFNMHGGTIVDFNGYNVPTTCPSTTTCYADAPLDLLGPGTMPVTLTVYGRTISVGNFTYLPSGPACTYDGTIEPGTFDVQCTPDSLKDPIIVYVQNGSAWDIAYSYNVSGGSTLQTFASPLDVDTQTMEACFSVNGALTSPGQEGCDSPSTVTIPPRFHVPF